MWLHGLSLPLSLSLSYLDVSSNSYVTITREEAYLKLPGWKVGDLRFSFRTPEKNTILLYQSSVEGNTNYFKVMLKSGKTIAVGI